MHSDFVYIGNVNPTKLILPILRFILCGSENYNRGDSFFCLIHVIFKLCFTSALSQTFCHKFLSQLKYHYTYNRQKIVLNFKGMFTDAAYISYEVKNRRNFG
jgi:hypothetical protein